VTGRDDETDRKRRSVLYVQYANAAAYPPVQHSAALLAEAGWNVRVLGVAKREIMRLEFPRHPRIEFTLAPPPSSGWRLKLHYFWFCCWALAWALRNRPDWIYASDPLACAVGLLGSYLPGTSVVYHEHDAPSADSASGLARFIAAARPRLLRRARVVVVPNAERGRRLVEIAGSQIPLVCVWNCPSRDEVARQPRQPKTEEDFWLVYHGTIVPARLPHTVIQALANLPSAVKLRIHGYETAGHEGYVATLQKLADQLGVRNRVEVQLAVPTRAELLDLVDRCQLGLALMPAVSNDLNERTMAGASNKAFDYLARGVPVLVSDLPDWRQMFVEPGFGKSCAAEDVGSVTEAVRWFLDHPDEARLMGDHGRHRVAEVWNYEVQFHPVLTVMQASS
jgi:glycosyltransferase involved in cell wall biosynthesis